MIEVVRTHALICIMNLKPLIASLWAANFIVLVLYR